ncbi:MAG: YtxH domain-containing protein, partial [Anaerolineales bacterium]
MTDRTNGTGSSPTSFILGSIIGAMAGAVTALLLAPQSGDETQEEIKKKASAIREDADRAVEQRKGLAAERIAQARNSVAEWFNK